MGIDKGIMKSIEDHRQKIQGPHFLFSAENPKFPKNNKLGLGHKEVLSHLQGAGYDAHSVSGHYGAPEKSIIVYGVSPKHAEKLHGMASNLGQDSSIYSTGKEHEMRFHHGADKGKKVTGEGTNWHKEKPKDFFTTLPGGLHHFTHNFNFDKSENDSVKLIHYSNKEGLSHIDPKFKGSAMANIKRDKNSEHPHSFYYKEGTPEEEHVARNSTYKYHVNLDPKKHKIYDAGKDPLNLVSKVKQENQNIFNMDMLHAKIKENGYHGFQNSKHDDYPGVVLMYHPLPVEHHEKLR